MRTKRGLNWHPRENWYRDLVLVIVCIFVVRSVTGIEHANQHIRTQAVRTEQTNVRLQRVNERLRKESRIRRDQTCIFFERQWQTDIDDLGRTYEYLDNLSPQQRREPLNIAIARSLPRLEQLVGMPAHGKKKRIVGTQEPPPYCKGKVGLDDSKFLPIPKRPRDLPLTP